MSRRTPDLDRVRAVTANFFFWQGLRWVPMGIALILCALIPYGRSTIGRTWTNVLTSAGMVVALWLSTGVLGRYYARMYGRVQGIPGQHARRSRIKWLLVYPAMFGAMILDWRLNAPIFMSGIVFAAGIEAYRRSTGGGRLHYVAAAAVLVLLATLPLTGVAASRDLLLPLLGILGGIYVVGGILDHFELARVLGPTQAETEDSGSTI